jgi:hypothetical protein
MVTRDGAAERSIFEVDRSARKSIAQRSLSARTGKGDGRVERSIDRSDENRSLSKSRSKSSALCVLSDRAINFLCSRNLIKIGCTCMYTQPTTNIEAYMGATLKNRSFDRSIAQHAPHPCGSPPSAPCPVRIKRGSRARQQAQYREEGGRL